METHAPETLRPRLQPGPRHFGVAAALEDGYTALDVIAQGLDAFAHQHRPIMRGPIRIDSRRFCLLTYGAALGAVRHRFWTTTYLSSGFWGVEDAEILAWNRAAAETLAKNAGSARRLFLLKGSPEAEIRRWRDRRVLLAKYDDMAGIRELEERLNSLLANVDRLVALGCDVRIACDARETYRSLPAECAIDGTDAELAIYDDWRFDVFRGGSQGDVRAVEIYTPAVVDFDALLAQVSGFFEGLWTQAIPAAETLRRIRAAMDEAAGRIDYHPLWLARYDHDVCEADDRLKRAEFVEVERIIRDRRWWGQIDRFLDVGTCTARYPIALRNAVAEDGEIVGIDYDWDAVRFARHNLREICAGDGRIRIEHSDFCAEESPIAGPFQLITCMLGTLMHFPRRAGAATGYQDDLQRALMRFRTLLRDDGALIFTLWTDEARSKRDVLGIYSEEDKQKLAQWDGTSSEIAERLSLVGLDIVATVPVDGRMMLYCCAPAQ